MKIVLTFITMALSITVMAQWKTDANRLWICGHRGGFYEAFAENSLPLFKHTESHCEIKPPIIELDIRKSASGKLYILHDETVDRTTTGQGKIAGLTDEYLSTLFLKDAKGNITDQHLLTFDDMLQYVHQANVVMMLDVKADVWAEAVKQVTAAGLSDRCMVLTFNAANTKKVYDASHTIRISVLVRDDKDWEGIAALSIPSENLIAYVTSTTTLPLKAKLRNLHIPLMTDVSEFTRYNGELQPVKFYRDFVKNNYLDILITDYPIEVSKAF